MTTKAQQILDLHSAWNQAPNDEPVFVIRCDDWRYVMFLALNSKDKGGNRCMQALFKQALEMKKYHDENDIPF
jgi:hypothetical protein